MRKMLVLGLLVPLVFAPGCGGHSDPDARVKQLSVDAMWASVHGDYGKLWSYLPPRYRALTTRAHWESCRRKGGTPKGFKWLSFKAVSVEVQSLKLAIFGQHEVKVVTVTGKFSYKGKAMSGSNDLYWAYLDGQWRGLWSPAQVAAYKAGRCST